MEAALYPGLGKLPLFDPDLESSPPAAVVDFRLAVDRADALLIASPEYAHGISGVMKNALDWLVSFEGAVGKRVALINTSPRAHHAHDSLAEVLRTMSLEIVPGASLTIPLHGFHRSGEDLLNSEVVRDAVDRIFAALRVHLR